MENREIFSKIESLDSKKQEVLFLTQKYKNFKFSQKFLTQFDGIDESQIQEEDLESLKEKYKDFKFSKEFLVQFDGIDELQIQEEDKFDLEQILELVGQDEEKLKEILKKQYEEDNKFDVFEIYQLVGEDEKRFKEILRKLYFDEKTFDVNGEKLRLEDLQKRGYKKKIESVGREFAAYFDLILHDVLRYFELKSGISKEEKDTVNLEGEQIEVGKLSRFYSKEIISTLLDKKREEKNKGDFDYNTQLTDEDIQALGLDSKDVEEKSKEVKDLAWKYDFFKLVQKSVEKGYILTHREYELIEDVLSDLNDGEVVMFTGDTGSGKTELARFICEEYMGNGYVFVSGSKDLEVSDFTVDKNVTSKAPIETEPNIVTGEESFEKGIEDEEQAKDLLDSLLKQDAVKQKVVEKAKENGKSEEDIKQLKQELNDENLREKKLITEYHYMGLYKAANAGVPCIIDEVNLIRPEIFMALNDVLTKQTGDEIQLPNALRPIKVKDGFCIILTGNDPEQNSDVKRYTAGRYNFDEATYNRLKVYAKNYLNQTVEEKKENKIQEDLEETQNYLEDNELFGVMLMMMFQTNKDLNASGKYGYEIMKRNFEGNNIGKSEFFETIKRFAYSVSKIQKAFAGEVINLSGEDAGMSLKDKIKRKVFSMRDLVKVLSSYKDDTLPLDFHIYDDFIKHTTNEDEQYALLKIFSEYGFFGNLVTDNKKSAIKNVNRKMQELKGKRKEFESDDIENKVVITKQDLYTQYFGSMGLDDDFFEKQKQEIQNADQEDEEIVGENEDEFDFLDDSEIEVEKEDLLETINLVKNTFSEGIDKFGLKDSAVIIEVSNVLNILEEEINKDNLEKSIYKKINFLLRKLNNQLAASNIEGVKDSINQLKNSLQ